MKQTFSIVIILTLAIMVGLLAQQPQPKPAQVTFSAPSNAVQVQPATTITIVQGLSCAQLAASLNNAPCVSAPVSSLDMTNLEKSRVDDFSVVGTSLVPNTPDLPTQVAVKLQTMVFSALEITYPSASEAAAREAIKASRLATDQARKDQIMALKRRATPATSTK